MKIGNLIFSDGMEPEVEKFRPWGWNEYHSYLIEVVEWDLEGAMSMEEGSLCGNGDSREVKGTLLEALLALRELVEEHFPEWKEGLSDEVEITISVVEEGLSWAVTQEELSNLGKFLWVVIEGLYDGEFTDHTAVAAFSEKEPAKRLAELLDRGDGGDCLALPVLDGLRVEDPEYEVGSIIEGTIEEVHEYYFLSGDSRAIKLKGFEKLFRVGYGEFVVGNTLRFRVCHNEFVWDGNESFGYWRPKLEVAREEKE